MTNYKGRLYRDETMLVKFTADSITLFTKEEEQQQILEVAFIEKILNLVDDGDLARCRREDLPDGTVRLVIEKLIGGMQPHYAKLKKK